MELNKILRKSLLILFIFVISFGLVFIGDWTFRIIAGLLLVWLTLQIIEKMKKTIMIIEIICVGLLAYYSYDKGLKLLFTLIMVYWCYLVYKFGKENITIIDE
jgi:hypothetical protein